MSKAIKYLFKCNFCETKFKKSIPRNYEVICPKCSEYDVELLGEPKGAGIVRVVTGAK